MQPVQNTQSDQQLPATGNPQNIGKPSIVNPQSNLQQTAGLDAFKSSTDRGVPIRIDASNLTREIQKQSAPPANNNKANVLWSISIAALIIAIILFAIGSRAQKKST